MSIKGAQRLSDGDARSSFQTIVGLFEDTLDTQEALRALKKGRVDPACVSLLLHHRKADEGGPQDRQTAVAQAIAALDLDNGASWLCGLASLIVPERGTYLAAGLFGAALARFDAPPEQHIQADSRLATADATETLLITGGLLRTLESFGFPAEQATYLEHRLMADATLLAVTSEQPETLQLARRIFADYNAVHIGLVATPERTARDAAACLGAPLDTTPGGFAVVTDAVVPLTKVRAERMEAHPGFKLGGRPVVDADGEECGAIIEVLADDAADGGAASIRYVVVGFGGLLGIGRHFVAVPAELVALDADPIRLAVERDVLERAPAYDPDIPVSRREEEVICAYFGLKPHWEETR